MSCGEKGGRPHGGHAVDAKPHDGRAEERKLHSDCADEGPPHDGCADFTGVSLSAIQVDIFFKYDKKRAIFANTFGNSAIAAKHSSYYRIDHHHQNHCTITGYRRRRRPETQSLPDRDLSASVSPSSFMLFSGACRLGRPRRPPLASRGAATGVGGHAPPAAPP